MTSFRTIDHLKVWQLRHWAYLTGISSPTRKAELQEAVMRSLESMKPNTGRRVVSVDMGIRNLAYCVVDADPMPQGNDSSRSFTVRSWTRRDLLKPTAPEVTLLQGSDSTQEVSIAKMAKHLKRKRDTTAFTPAELSKTAYKVVTALLSHSPDDVLIEQQRFRSGGASAIQEWTVRVNMLESMLWATLETLRASGPARALFPDVHAVSPRRVAEFWLSGRNQPMTPPGHMFDADNLQPAEMVPAKPRVPQSKIEKKEKVDHVRKWVMGNGGTGTVNLLFKDQAADVAQAFKEQTSRGANKIAGGKLDDLADCLLQAIAHLRWEDNKRVIRQMLLQEPS